MHVIILAAGQSKRFQKEGYMTPKPFLEIEWRGTTQPMLHHVFCTIPMSMEDSNNLYVAIPKGWKKEAYGVPDPSLIELEDTKGPAHTTLKILKSLRRDSCLIMDVDILNFTNDLYYLTKLPTHYSCGVLISESANPAFSYVDSAWNFKRIAEKERISKYAVRGAYFIHKNIFPEFMDKLSATVKEKEEPFISHVFNKLDVEKRALKTKYTPIDWGTPQDIQLSGAHIITQKEPAYARH